MCSGEVVRVNMEWFYMKTSPVWDTVWWTGDWVQVFWHRSHVVSVSSSNSWRCIYTHWLLMSQRKWHFTTFYIQIKRWYFSLLKFTIHLLQGWLLFILSSTIHNKRHITMCCKYSVRSCYCICRVESLSPVHEHCSHTVALDPDSSKMRTHVFINRCWQAMKVHRCTCRIYARTAWLYD